MKKFLLGLLLISSTAVFANDFNFIVTNNTDKDMIIDGDKGLFKNPEFSVLKGKTQVFKINKQNLDNSQNGLSVEIYPTDSVRLAYLFDFQKTTNHELQWINWLIAPEKSFTWEMTNNNRDLNVWICEKARYQVAGNCK